MKAVFRPLIIALLVISPALQAADDPAAAADPLLQQAREAAARKDFAAAAALLRDALAKTPENPEYHNLYAYAVRKGPDPNMDLVFKHYHEALRLAPKHRGAHEYIGEAYLMVGNLPKAREHLTQLDRLCFFGCEEYSSLKKAIQAHEAKGGR
ncbi:MAG: tetratricopeptide repeat protein [Betaproteobacteria bacterium]|nr:tetratricopeptide repeat protein [Betaproteobacteria bacterium]